MSNNTLNQPMITLNSTDLTEMSTEEITNLFMNELCFDPSLPDWASAHADGNWFPSAQLSTKDGRVTGNGVLMWWTISNGLPAAVIVTDAGNVIFASQNEMEEMFYPPQFLMREPLYAHIAGIMTSGVEIPDEYMFLFESEFFNSTTETDYVVADFEDSEEGFDESPNPIVVAMMDSILKDINDGPKLIEEYPYPISDTEQNDQFSISIHDVNGDIVTANFDTAEELNEFMAQMGLPFQI